MISYMGEVLDRWFGDENLMSVVSLNAKPREKGHILFSSDTFFKTYNFPDITFRYKAYRDLVQS